MSYLLDTNTAIYFTNGELTPAADTVITSSQPTISFITHIELLAWPQLSVKQEEILNRFIKASHIYSCDESIILQTIAIRKQYKLKLPDAFIAATAITHHLTLLSRNLKDFKDIVDFVVIDPFTL